MAGMHLEKGGGKGTGLIGFGKKDDAAAKSEKCLSCHENGRVLTFWSMGAHKKNDVACSDCHSIHKKAGKKEYEGCVSCHPSVRAEINKRSHHPIIEGKVKCSNCHNPHGSSGSNGQQPNDFLISDQRPGWYGLTDIKNDSVQVRRFCTGCHAYPDQPGSVGTVEGITAERLPDEYPHRSYETRHCYDCHGRDYSSPNGFNVHNPSEGEGGEAGGGG